MQERIRAEARKRRPHLTMGCVIAGLALAPAGRTAIGIASVIAASAACWIFGRAASVIAVTIVLGASLVGVLRIGTIDRPASAARPGTAIDAQATLLERPRIGVFGTTAAMRVEDGAARGLRILARFDGHGWLAADAGMRFRIHGFVRRPDPPESTSAAFATAASGAFATAASGASATGASGASATGASMPAAQSSSGVTEANAGAPGTPGSGPLPARPEPGSAFDFAAFLRSRGIGREVRIESLQPIGRRGGLAGVVDSMRRRAETGISAGLSPEFAALARGMVLGEDGDVPETRRDDFRRAGLAHLLAASGQNIALLCALALPLLMLVGAPQRVRVGVLLPLVALYVALAGSGASIMRAGIMAASALFAIAVSRRSSAVYSLLLAAAVTLALNPRASGDPGWQLSFAAVGGMLALGPLIQPAFRRLPPQVAEALGATIAATVATSPLLAHEFGAISFAALPANLIVFPAVAPIMWIGMGEAAVEQLAAPGAPFETLTHGLQTAVAPVSELALRWVAGVATHFADHTWAKATIHLSWPGVVAAYAGIAAIAFLASRRRRRFVRAWIHAAAAGIGAHRRASAESAALDPRAAPGARIGHAAGEALDWLRALSPASRRAFAAPIVVLALAAAAHVTAPPPPPRHLTIDFIDVGQGDSTLIRDSTGAAVLFDGGVPEARVDRTLRRLGVRKLSVVVATHQSRDHHAGLLQVVKRFPVGLFLDGRDGVDDPSFIALEQEVDRRRIPRRPTRAGEQLRVGGVTIRIVWPPPRDTRTPPPGDPNERATVAIVSEGGFDLFLSADAESPVLRNLDLPRVEAMKVPHHGSSDPRLAALLDRLGPAVAAIETGRGNRYGHPRPSTLNALRKRVPRVYRTDRDGTTELTVQRDRIVIRTHR
jgi:competence protein ComEC